MVDRTSLASLELLVALDTHGSISAAARALAIAQPTASAGLRRLERRLGLELVTRGSRGTALTPTGQAAAGWAREVVEASQRFETAAAGLRAGPTTALRVAASLTVAEYLVPRWLAQLAVQGSGEDVELLVRNSHDVMELVLEGGAQLGFVESLGVRRGLRSRNGAHDELVAVVAPGDRWGRGSCSPAGWSCARPARAPGRSWNGHSPPSARACPPTFRPWARRRRSRRPCSTAARSRCCPGSRWPTTSRRAGSSRSGSTAST